MIRQREERSRITIWSGGQTSGGQTSGPHTIVSLSFEHNVLKCVGLRVGVNLEKRTLIAGCRADGSEKLAPRCLPSVKTPVKAHPGGSSVRAWPQGRRWRWRAVEREENKWAVSTHFPPSQDIAPKPDSLILTAATGYAVASPLEPKGTKPAPQTVKRRRFALGGLTHTKQGRIDKLHEFDRVSSHATACD